MTDDDTGALLRILLAGLGGERLAVDTETNARSVHSPALECRLVSVASSTDSVVLPLVGHRAPLRALLGDSRLRWVCHNAEFDKQVIRSALGIELLDVRDTYVIAHLADPRQRSEGGTGHRLAELGVRYGLKTKETDLLKARMKEHLWTWATIPVDDPVYRSYARTDARLTKDLLTHLDPDESISPLEAFEYQVAGVCARMERKGILVDRVYTEALVTRLHEEAAVWSAQARELGVNNVDSPQQVTRALGTTDAAKETLLPLAGLTPTWEPIDGATVNPLALAVIRAKRAHRWATAYGEAFLNESELDGRLHASIVPLRARTARMAISKPPLQQLPAGEASVRRCLIADPGQVIFACDFAAVEFRVLAALSKDKVLTALIAAGEDIHDNTARAVFGPNFTKAQRKLAKIAGFCVCYGGGVKAIMTQTGCSMAMAKTIRDGFLKTYPGVARLTRSLAATAERRGAVISRTGRWMPVDRDRSYSALNYVIQSSARDVYAESLLRIDEAGLSDHLLLPVHDEVICQAPVAHAAEIMEAVRSAMETTLDGVHIAATGSVYGLSWGHGYGAVA